MRYEYFMKKAASLGCRIFFKACVMADTPSVDFIMYGLKREISFSMSVLSGTTNYVLGLIEDSLNFRGAVKRAVVEGYAEPNYATDSEGIDLAAKEASIPYSLSMKPISINDVIIESKIDEGVEEIIENTRSERLKVRYVAVLLRNEAPRVKLVTLSEEDIMAQVKGVQNCVKIVTLDESKTLLMGPGTGHRVTALTLSSDLLLSVHKVWDGGN